MRFFACFDSTVLTFFRSQSHDVHVRRRENTQHFFAASLSQMVGKEATVADDQAHGHFLLWHKIPRYETALKTRVPERTRERAWLSGTTLVAVIASDLPVARNKLGYRAFSESVCRATRVKAGTLPWQCRLCNRPSAQRIRESRHCARHPRV